MKGLKGVLICILGVYSCNQHCTPNVFRPLHKRLRTYWFFHFSTSNVRRGDRLCGRVKNRVRWKWVAGEQSRRTTTQTGPRSPLLGLPDSGLRKVHWIAGTCYFSYLTNTFLETLTTVCSRSSKNNQCIKLVTQRIN
jgi:hypothetical protein